MANIFLVKVPNFSADLKLLYSHIDLSKIVKEKSYGHFKPGWTHDELHQSLTRLANSTIENPTLVLVRVYQ